MEGTGQYRESFLIEAAQHWLDTPWLPAAYFSSSDQLPMVFCIMPEELHFWLSFVQTGRHYPATKCDIAYPSTDSINSIVMSVGRRIQRSVAVPISAQFPIIVLFSGTVRLDINWAGRAGSPFCPGLTLGKCPWGNEETTGHCRVSCPVYSYHEMETETQRTVTDGWTQECWRQTKIKVTMLMFTLGGLRYWNRIYFHQIVRFLMICKL